MYVGPIASSSSASSLASSGMLPSAGSSSAGRRSGSTSQRQPARPRRGRRRGQRDATREGAQRFRRALEELGTTYIKLGQLLSSRPDLLPDVYIDELSHLVDEVPPVAFAEIDAVIRTDLGEDARDRALVGKTLAQADAVARTLDPTMDPTALVEAEALEVMLTEAERRLEPNRLLAYLSTQLDPLTRMPRRLGHVLSELEANFRSIANRMLWKIIRTSGEL